MTEINRIGAGPVLPEPPVVEAPRAETDATITATEQEIASKKEELRLRAEAYKLRFAAEPLPLETTRKPPESGELSTFSPPDPSEPIPYADVESVNEARETAQRVRDEQSNPTEFGIYVRDHQNDPVALYYFFRELGPENAARLTRLAAIGGGQLGANVRTDMLANAFATLVKDGKFTQGDMDAFLEGYLTAEGRNIIDDPEAVRAALIDLTTSLARLPYSAESEALKTQFFKSAADLALTGTALPAEVRLDLAAAATEALAATSADNQLRQLQALRDRYGDAGLTRFVQDAMKGQDFYLDPGTARSPKEFGKISSLIFNLAYADVRDSFQGPSPVTPGQLSALRTTVFNAATRALADGSHRDGHGRTNFEKFRADNFFKDGLAGIYQKEYQSITRSSLTGASGEVFSQEAQHGLEKFYELALFTPPPGYQAGSLIKFIDGQFGEMADDLQSHQGDAQFFRNKYGLDEDGLARVLGAQVGMVFEAMESGIEAIGENAAAKAKVVKTFIDAVASGLGNTGGKYSPLTAAAASFIAATVGGDIETTVRDEEFEKKLTQLIKGGVDPTKIISNLYHGIHERVPSGPDGSTLSAYEAGYSYVAGQPEPPTP